MARSNKTNEEISNEITDDIIEEANTVDDSERKPFDPLLAENVNEKAYGKDNIRIKQIESGELTDIPEPTIEIPIIDLDESEYTETRSEEKTHKRSSDENPSSYQSQTRGSQSVKNPLDNKINPSFSELSKKDKNKGAERFADMVISAYEWAHTIGKQLMAISDDSLRKKAAKGKFDLRALDLEIELSEDGSQTTTLGEFLEDYNRQLENTLVVSEEFKLQIKPLLINLFVKKGWGLTEEQSLIYTIGEDAVPKIITLVHIKSTVNSLLKSVMTLISQNDNQIKQSVQSSIQKEDMPKEQPESEGKDIEPEDLKQESTQKQSRTWKSPRGRKKKEVIEMAEPEESNYQNKNDNIQTAQIIEE